MNLYHALYAHRSNAQPLFRSLDHTLMSTGEFRTLVGRYCSALQELGVMPGDRVSFQLEKSVEAVALAHACLQAGAIMHPLNTAYTTEEASYLLADARPALFVCSSASRGALQGVCESLGVPLQTLDPEQGGGSLHTLVKAQRPAATVAQVDEDTAAALLYTSGTTGKPKGALITHGNLVQSARALVEVWGLRPSDVLLHALPVYHAHGLLTAINSLMVAGGSILFLPRFDVDEVLRGLAQSTLMMGVPTHYGRLARDTRLRAALGSEFRMAISGSSKLSPVVAQAFHDATGHTLIERYGSTETAIVAAVPPERTDRAGWVGWPLPGVEVRVRDAHGNTHRSNATGVVETRGHNVFKGYWNRADDTSFTGDGWFITGDIAQLDDSGCLKLLDRTSDLIISGGLNVYPKEVEDVLERLPGVEQAAVFGVPHPDFGEAVAAVLVMTEPQTFDEARLIEQARTRLAAFKVPKRLLCVDEIPINRLGKVQKHQLRTAYQNLFTP